MWSSRGRTHEYFYFFVPNIISCVPWHTPDMLSCMLINPQWWNCYNICSHKSETNGKLKGHLKATFNNSNYYMHTCELYIFTSSFQASDMQTGPAKIDPQMAADRLLLQSSASVDRQILEILSFVRLHDRVVKTDRWKGDHKQLFWDTFADYQKHTARKSLMNTFTDCNLLFDESNFPSLTENSNSPTKFTWWLILILCRYFLTTPTPCAD